MMVLCLFICDLTGSKNVDLSFTGSAVVDKRPNPIFLAHILTNYLRNFQIQMSLDRCGPLSYSKVAREV